MNTITLDNALTSMLKNPAGHTDMKFTGFLTGKNRKLSLVLECEALGDIIDGEYGQSVLCSLLSEDQKEIINGLEDEVEKHTPEDFANRQFLRADRFFLKLQTKDGNYKATMNPPQDAGEPEKSSFVNGISVVIECKPGAYFNFKEKTTGLYLQATKITIGKPKTRKR